MTDKRPPPKDPDTPKQESGGDHKRPRHQPEGREHQVHKEILERRWRGGPAPTPEEYQRSLEEWKNLPGSIVRPPTDHKPPAGPPPESADKPEDED
ncbi:MAG: hypothetical protein OJF60_001762 [Burkholderiaceae bacterium]|nr:MAG: hypothetical protein OJF60_001762 [Burkholderiaceae bacterium]